MIKGLQKIPAIVTFLFLILHGVSGFANVKYVPADSSSTRNSVMNYAHIQIYGEIKASDVSDVSRLVDNKSLFDSSIRMIPVFLDSRGGKLIAAMQIGRILRKADAWTMVDLYTECSSACIFILASGVERDVFQGAKLGLHRPQFSPERFGNLSSAKAMAVYDNLIQKCRSYFQRMGISAKLLQDMLKVESRKVDYKDRNYAEKVSLVGEDPGFHQWKRAKDLKQNGKAKVRAQDRLIDCYNSATPKSICDSEYLENLKKINSK